MSAEAWAAEFDRYREIPQYQIVNQGMSLEEFKFIYWWEWGHRQLGRVIGLVWAAGFLWFLARGASRPAGRRACSGSARSAGCRGRSAGGWWPRGWRAG
jgi:heme a synthase